jgi:hypothetical protein
VILQKFKLRRRQRSSSNQAEELEKPQHPHKVATEASVAALRSYIKVEIGALRNSRRSYIQPHKGAV